MSSITAGQSHLATIDTRDLRALLYGEVTTHDDLITLAQIAQEAGTDLADLAAATGEPGHDPRTGPTNPRAVYEADVAEDALLADEEPDEAALWAEGPLEGEDLEQTVTRRQAAADIADERAAELAADLVEVALEMPDRARALASCLRQRGVLSGTTDAPVAEGIELAEVA